jgi:hypothetical protein
VAVATPAPLVAGPALAVAASPRSQIAKVKTDPCAVLRARPRTGRCRRASVSHRRVYAKKTTLGPSSAQQNDRRPLSAAANARSAPGGREHAMTDARRPDDCTFGNGLGRRNNARHVVVSFEGTPGLDLVSLHLGLPADPPTSPRQPAGSHSLLKPRDRGGSLAAPAVPEPRGSVAVRALPGLERESGVLESYPRWPGDLRVPRFVGRLQPFHGQTAPSTRVTSRTSAPGPPARRRPL